MPILAASSLIAFDDRRPEPDQRPGHVVCGVVAGAFLGSAIGHFLVHRHGEQENGVFSKTTLEMAPINHRLAARIDF
jgi:hypothetical protein